jgi:hypothetical protein
MNGINEELDFIATEEINNSVNYLAVTINRNINKIELNIYRKPTSADITIQYTSNHPQDHKLAAFTFYINRMLTLPITEQAKKQEWEKILTIAQQNGFPIDTIHDIKKQEIAKQRKNQVIKEEQQTKQIQNQKNG